ncbi:MAG TPA: phosphate--AMP phosphotransferase, partial [Clostridia bacterium]|nr:phosphate--AMP phosphotransferase [Clostridia bacterium]
MFEKIELNKEMPKAEYKHAKKTFESQIGKLQRRFKEENIPIIIVFEGWDAAGKGSLINQLILPMDPRGFKVHTIDEPKCDELRMPHLWRFWTKIPKRGRLAIFDRSWYQRTFEGRLDAKMDKVKSRESYDEICDFERQLTDDGYLIIKLFIHISKEEQKKRFRKLESNETTGWRVTEKDWRQNEKYDEYLEAVEEAIRETDNQYAAWTVIEGTNRRFASAKMYWSVLKALEERLEKVEKEKCEKDPKEKINVYQMSDMNASILKSVDLRVSLSREEYRKQL